MKSLFILWVELTKASFKTFFMSRFGAILFFTGKILRFFFFGFFLLMLLSKTKILAGYSTYQILLFYLTFNFIDAGTQMLMREVYRFRQQVLTGSFDFILLKPASPLFRSLFGGADFLDFITLFPFAVLMAVLFFRIPDVTIFGVILFFLLLLNAFIIAIGFHIIVLSLAVLTTEVDHAIMIYRDILGMGKVPIDIYREPISIIFTFFIPVGIMTSFPVKALSGLLGMQSILFAFFISGAFLFVSLRIWRFALTKYTSASS